jgi:SOS-response transcriptional repressor LexA
MQTLTRPQAECLAVLIAYQDEHGHAPTFRALADALGMSSTSGVHRLVGQLEQRGALVKSGNKYRSAAAYQFVATPPFQKAEYFLRLMMDQIDQMTFMRSDDDLYIRIRKAMHKHDEETGASR